MSLLSGSRIGRSCRPGQGGRIADSIPDFAYHGIPSSNGHDSCRKEWVITFPDCGASGFRSSPAGNLGSADLALGRDPILQFRLPKIEGCWSRPRQLTLTACLGPGDGWAGPWRRFAHSPIEWESSGTGNIFVGRWRGLMSTPS